jgi:hypothetical protein
MNEIDAKNIIDKMMQLWPDWDPTEQELGVFKYKLYKFDVKAAIKAINEAAFESNYRTPPRKSLSKLLNRYQPSKETQQFAVMPEPTIFVQLYSGGNANCRLSPGYYVPVIGRDSLSHLKDAEHAKTKLEDLHGGEWRIYENCTHNDMILMRDELRCVEAVPELANIFAGVGAIDYQPHDITGERVKQIEDLHESVEDEPEKYEGLPF